jgi:hypothetical protein
LNSCFMDARTWITVDSTFISKTEMIVELVGNSLFTGGLRAGHVDRRMT